MKLTIASVVKDEMGGFLPKALETWLEIADEVRILDNGSTDGTLDHLASQKVTFQTCDTPMDGNESAVRAELFDFATQDAEWVIWLDADQTLSADPRPWLQGNRVAFYVYDLWSPDTYRKDAWWKVSPWWGAIDASELGDFRPKWSGRGWHSGHLPVNIRELGPVTHMPPDVAVLHYGYATPELRTRHHAAYMARTQHLTPAETFMAQTIVQDRVKTYDLPFTPRWSLM